MDKKDLKKTNVSGFKSDILGNLSYGGLYGLPGIEGHFQYRHDAGDEEVSGWFLGTRAENSPLFSRFIQEAINIISFGRKSFHPEDPSHITEEIKNSPGYLTAIQSLEDNFYRLASFLNSYATPFYSMRYQGHMTWETTMPALLGYFITMLHNSNNVTVQASTATTFLEYMVGKDICNMIAFDPATSWAHITCDGTVANLESMWAAREVKFLPPGIQDALKKEATFAPAKDIEVTLPDGSSKKLIDMDTWQLINLTCDAVLAIPQAIAKKIKHLPQYKDKTIEEVEDDVWNTLVNFYSLNALGIMDFTQRYLQDIKPPVVIVPSTKHYSWPKSAAVLGLGYEDKYKGGKCKESEIAKLFKGNTINIPVDEHARMEKEILAKAVECCYVEKIPIVMVVAVMGSTEESAVDPLKDIVDLRKKWWKQNFNFNLHSDAAWGGYLLSVLRKDFDIRWPSMTRETLAKREDPWTNKPVPLSKYVILHMKHIRDCDSVTIDPHKWGYIPYPAGSLSYQNEKMIKLLQFTAPYIEAQGPGNGIKVPPVGEYGIEGSKPGASPAAVFLSHSVIRPSVKGYGKIIERSLINSKMLYVYMLFMEEKGDPFFVIPLPKLPEAPGGKDPLKYIKENIYGKRVDQLRQNKETWSYFCELGADQNILDYAFNFYIDKDNTIPNTDVNKLNQLNQMVYDSLHIEPGEKIDKYDLLVTMTSFYLQEYGDTFIYDFFDRLVKIKGQKPEIDFINCLRSVVMDPWLAETRIKGENNEEKHLNFVQAVIIPTLRKTVIMCAEEIKKKE
jgi:glutamate/tyrosine decarboxylase-like PLP-dependent enzyme